ncbi:MAG: potassium-transporting ATPase subunit KdpC [Hyphomicrobium sp.]|jgi:K+-transporting ATPase ATPase C chain|uniref:potassium-transporting ATPase subunit KdpC n=1 Tax=Hyphomicrobium sp. TaxID=82 RepID=UPI0025C22CA9|nr:potassium-transporting ATPase subunit KdpC [Hyphomicrobium sp.]MBX9863265.1 potassium-transporting ATPase subunit KdpC [Hyphomicrobium sp.]
MTSHLRPAVVLLGAFTILTGIAYPLAMTGIVQIVLPDQANGSMIERGGAIVGSSLIGQPFTSDRYFHPRPSAAGQNGYDAAASSGSNLGPLSAKLLDRVKHDAAELRGGRTAAIPADAVTTSASGLDPHVSPAYADMQVERVAKARGVSPDRVRAVVAGNAAGDDLGIIGEPRINVLELNLALDAALGTGSG